MAMLDRLTGRAESLLATLRGVRPRLTLPGILSTPEATDTDPAGDKWSGANYIRFGMFCLVLLVGGLGGWAATAKLKGAVIASGHLRVEAQRQVVQHPDGGVVGEILVREGDRVEAGAVLIRLDGVKLHSELTVLESQLWELIARRGRLDAEQTDADAITFDPEIIEAAAGDPSVKGLLDGQQAQFDASRSTLQREIEVLKEQQVQIREQIIGSEAEISALERQSQLIEKELVDQRGLLAKGLAQATRVLALEREAASLAGERGQRMAQTAQLKGQIAEIEIEQLRLAASRREEAVTTLRDIGFRELELKERRIALKDQLSRLDVRAPLAGIVLDMTVHALKSVVRAAEPILHIVPTDFGPCRRCPGRADQHRLGAARPGGGAALLGLQHPHDAGARGDRRQGLARRLRRRAEQALVLPRRGCAAGRRDREAGRAGLGRRHAGGGVHPDRRADTLQLSGQADLGLLRPRRPRGVAPGS